MMRATHLTSVLIALFTTTSALVPQQLNRAENDVFNVQRRQIPADQVKMLLDAAAAGVKAVDATVQKRQAPNQLCIDDAMLSMYQNDPQATPLCSALIKQPPVTLTATANGTTTTTVLTTATRSHTALVSSTTTSVETVIAPTGGAKRKRQDSGGDVFSSIISACNCLSIPLSTTTTTTTAYSTRIVSGRQFTDPTTTITAVITATSTTTVILGSSSSTITSMTTNPCGTTASASFWTSETTMSDGFWVRESGYYCSASSAYEWSSAWSTIESGGPSPISALPTPPPFPSTFTGYSPYDNSTSSGFPISSFGEPRTPGTFGPSSSTTRSFPTNSTSIMTSTISSTGEPRTGSQSPPFSSSGDSIYTQSVPFSFRPPGYSRPPYSPSVSSSMPFANSTSITPFSISSTGEPRIPSNFSSTRSSTPVGPVINSTSSLITAYTFPSYSHYTPTVTSSAASSPSTPAGTASTLPRTPGTFGASSSSTVSPFPMPSGNSSSSIPGTSVIGSSSSAPYPFPSSNLTSSMPGTGAAVPPVSTLFPNSSAPYPIPSGNSSSSMPGTGTGVTANPTFSSASSDPAGTGSTLPRTPGTFSSGSSSTRPPFPFSSGNTTMPSGTGTGTGSTPFSPTITSNMTYSSRPTTPPYSVPGNITSSMIGTGTAPIISSSATPRYPTNSTMTSVPMGKGTSSTFSISSSGEGRSGSQIPSSRTITSSCPACTASTVTVTAMASTCSTATTTVISTTIVSQNTCTLLNYGYGPYSRPTPVVVGPPIYTPSPAPVDQVIAACSIDGTIVTNGGFETYNNGSCASAVDWNTYASDPCVIDFTDVGVAEATQHTVGGSRLGQINATEAASIALWQEVVMCTGTQYCLEAYMSQSDGDSVCTVDFYLGLDLVFSAQPALEPGANGSLLQYYGNYISRDTAEAASAYLTAVINCDGPAVLDVDDISLYWGVSP